MCPPVFQQAGMAVNPPLPDKDDRVLPGDPTMPPQDLDERSLASLIAPPNQAVNISLFFCFPPLFTFRKCGQRLLFPPVLPFHIYFKYLKIRT